MSDFRDNPSDAEKERPLSNREIRRYVRYVRIGFFGLLSVLGVFIALQAGWIPVKGTYQLWAVAYLILGFVLYSVTLVAGLSKGRDHRPSIMQMLAGGGRR